MSMKSCHALECNVKLLFEAGRPVYFWTFTLPQQLHPYDAAALWKPLGRDLVRSVGLAGVRVFELHPKGHGLHVHLATNNYVRVEVVREIVRKHNWGRIHVCKWDLEECAGYMAKYLTKQRKYYKGQKILGIRWWALFGDLPDRVRVLDVVSRSFFKEIFHSLTDDMVVICMGAKLPVAGNKKSTSAFTFAKMRLAKQIYAVPDLRIGVFNFQQLRSLAWMLSQPSTGLAVGG